MKSIYLEILKIFIFYFVIFLVVIYLYSCFVHYMVNHYGNLNEYTYNLGKKFLDSKFLNIVAFSAIFSIIFTLGDLE